MRVLVPFLVTLALALVARAASPMPHTGTPGKPHEIEIPPGFVRLDVGGRIAWCEPADESWVRETFEELAAAATTRPTPDPAAMLERCAAQRDAITADVLKTLALPDAAAVAPLFEERLLPDLRRALKEQQRPPNVTYLVVERARLKELAKAGWTDGSIRYDPAADIVDVPQLGRTDFRVINALEVQPALFDAPDTPDARRAALVLATRAPEAYAERYLAMDLVRDLDNAFIGFVQDVAYLPLGMDVWETGWWGLGIGGVLAARHGAAILGVAPEGNYARMTTPSAEELREAVGPLCLRHPGALEKVREQELRRGMVVVTEWTRRGGADAIPKALVALRKLKRPPPNPAALVRVIRTSTGVDLTGDLQPKPRPRRAPLPRPTR